MQTLKPSIAKLDMTRTAPAATPRIRGHALQRIRQRIILRDEYTCQECGRVTPGGHVDHVTPLFMGGAECDANRAYLCIDCHQAKSDKEEQGRGGKIFAT